MGVRGDSHMVGQGNRGTLYGLRVMTFQKRFDICAASRGLNIGVITKEFQEQDVQSPQSPVLQNPFPLPRPFVSLTRMLLKYLLRLVFLKSHLCAPCGVSASPGVTPPLSSLLAPALRLPHSSLEAGLSLCLTSVSSVQEPLRPKQTQLLSSCSVSEEPSPAGDVSRALLLSLTRLPLHHPSHHALALQARLGSRGSQGPLLCSFL